MRTSVEAEETMGKVVRSVLLSFDDRDVSHDQQILALTGICAILGRGLVVGGVVERDDLRAAARALAEQLPPGSAGIEVIESFLGML
jgi:hypothetical protein